MRPLAFLAPIVTAHSVLFARETIIPVRPFVALWAVVLLLLPAASSARPLVIGSDAVHDVLAELSEEGWPVPEADVYPVVSGRVSLGAISTTGNTESQSIDGTAEIQFEYPKWRHTARATAYRTTEGDTVTGERYSGVLQTDYKLTLRSYAFANAGYVRDHFGAFERRVTASIGLGRRMVATATTDLDLEAGLGRRVQEPAGSDEEQWDTIVRLRGLLEWDFSDNSTFSQELQVEAGELNTYAESVTAVKSKLIGALSLRVSYTVQHNTDVPASTENTDTVTSIGLEYAF